MSYLVYGIVFAAMIYVALVSVVIVLSVRKMSRPDSLLESVHDLKRIETFPQITKWARENAFELDSQFLFDGLVGAGGLKMAVDGWYNATRMLFLMHYHVQDKSYYEFISGMDGGYSLSSSCSQESLGLPFPEKVFCQAFEGASLEELYAEHGRALAFFQERFGVKTVAPDLPLRGLIVRAIKRQMMYVQSLPFWYLRGVWWHTVRRRQLKNKSIISVIEGLE